MKRITKANRKNLDGMIYSMFRTAYTELLFEKLWGDFYSKAPKFYKEMEKIVNFSTLKFKNFL